MITSLDGKDVTKIEPIKLFTEEKSHRAEIFSLLETAKKQKNQARSEFDGMTLALWLKQNKKLMDGTFERKKNRTDVMYSMQTPRVKAKAIAANIFKMDFSPDVMAYDKDDYEDKGLGYALGQMLQKSDEIETGDYGGGKEEKFVLRVNRLLEQGLFVGRERWTPRTFFEKKITSGELDPAKGFEGLQWIKKEKTDYRCETQILDLNSVYFGDVSQYEMNKQPFVFTRAVLPYKVAEQIYFSWKNWKHVVPGNVYFEKTGDINDNYRVGILENDEVEIIEFERFGTCEYQLYINGVPMLPPDFPMWWKWRGYSMFKQTLFPFNEKFVYGKSLMAEVRGDGEVLDNMMTALISKTNQSIKPPFGNLTRKQLSPKIYDPGTIWNDVDPDKLKKIIDHNGVTSSEFQMFDVLRQILDTKTVNPIFMGQSGGGNTATEINEMQKQSQIALGLILLSVELMEEKRYYLRLADVLDHWTKPIEENIDEITQKVLKKYKRINTQDAEIEFSEEVPSDTERKKMSFDMLRESKTQKKEKRLTVIHLPLLEKLRHRFFIRCNPSNRPSDNLNKILFSEMINQAMTFFPQDINRDYFKREWATIWQKNPAEAFTNNSMGLMEQALGQTQNAKQLDGAKPRVAQNVIEGVKQQAQTL